MENKEKRIKEIDDAIHELMFEKRVLELNEEQTERMMNPGKLSDAQKKRVEDCKTDEQRDAVFKEYAEITYFKQCAWADYLNGTTEMMPFIPTKKVEVGAGHES